MTSAGDSSFSSGSPTLHLHDPSIPLPTPPSYLNPSYYLFQPSRAHTGTPPRNSIKSRKSSVRTKKGKSTAAEGSGIVRVRKDFDKFHGENGVRTVMGSIGPVQNGPSAVLTPDL